MCALRYLFLPVILLLFCCGPSEKTDDQTLLRLEQNAAAGTISVFRGNGTQPLLVQNASEGVRPYIHPVMAPDGKGELTEFSPAHHKHQTGLYWGLKELNGRDYFMNWKDDYWRRRSAEVLTEKGIAVKWRTVYDLLDPQGSPVLTETLTWSLREGGEEYILDLVWEGFAQTDVTMGKFYVGGLFVRMPWHEGVEGDAINSSGQRNGEAEGQRALWTDIGVPIPGRADHGHLAILDHPDNKGFPMPWRVDSQLGVGPSRQILGDWSIPQGEKEIIRYRIIAYTGARDERLVRKHWKEYVCE